MSIKLDFLFLNTPLLLILILLIIVLLFCFMQCYVYNSQPIMYNELDLKHDKKYNHTPTITQKINKIIELKDKEIKKNINILSGTIKETKKKMQENFEDLSVEEIRANLDTLDNLEINLTDFQNNDIVKIINTMALIQAQRIEDKDKIVDLLTNIYVLASIDNINKGNAASYKEYMKYKDLDNNIYYNQYR